MVAVGSCAAACVVGHGATQDANGWTEPRLAWGAPDLQGTWVNNENTPLERPDPVLDAPRLAALARLASKVCLTVEWALT